MADSIGTDIGAFIPTLTRRLVFVATFAAICLFAFLMFGVGQSVSVAVRPVASYDAAQAAHCSQFIEFARVKFGPEWRRRLDPRDTTCAQQIQEAWERDWSPRKPLPEPVLQPTMTARAARPAKIAPPEAGPAHDPETHSLAVATIITGASLGFASADATDQEGAHDFNADSSQNGDPGDAAREDRDEGVIGTSEQGHDERRLSARDYGANDDQTDATDALNNEQLRVRGRADDDLLGTSDADENDDNPDEALSRDSDQHEPDDAISAEPE